jgi:acyl CoA:acetate/3-ketoacid CoA transferase beta subunit
MAANNKINKDCVIHKKNCDLFCTSSKCVNKILCEKCIPDHLEVHPRQFIYSLENLSEIHSFDKVSKMKEVLGKHKVINEQRITKIYSGYDSILDPLI